MPLRHTRKGHIRLPGRRAGGETMLAKANLLGQNVATVTGRYLHSPALAAWRGHGVHPQGSDVLGW